MKNSLHNRRVTDKNEKMSLFYKGARVTSSLLTSTH
jgi:hypothetical protein